MKTVLALLAASILAGCSTTTYERDGVKFSRRSLFVQQNISGIEVRTSPMTGEQYLKIESATMDPKTEQAVALTQAAISAAVSGRVR